MGKDINFLFLDLEMNQPSQSIIQVGAVVANPFTKVVHEKLSVIIHRDEEVSEYIEKLTGITNDEVKSSQYSLHDANTKLVELHKKYDCFRNMVTWGGGDSHLLKKQLNETSSEFEWPFGDRWVDVKTIYIFFCLVTGRKVQSGLAKSMTKVGLRFQGTKHNAADDAYNTYLLFSHLLGNMETNIFAKEGVCV